VRILAHHPAQRLDEIRLAAAVRPDHAGEAGFDEEVGGLDEGLETDQPQSRQLHAEILLSCRAGDGSLVFRESLARPPACGRMERGRCEGKPKSGSSPKAARVWKSLQKLR
jgi:hypothetical protein